MLVSRSKPREIRVGMPETVYLVPELCILTGLTDRQRDNFQLMKALATHTRVAPDGRIKKLLEFSRQIQSKPEVVQEIRRWDLTIGDQLVDIEGRVLPQEKIHGGGGIQPYDAGPQADWTQKMRSNPLVDKGNMSRMAVIYPSRFKQQAKQFIESNLKRCAQGMAWSLDNCKPFEIPDDRAATYLQKIDEVIGQGQPSLILVVLSSKSQDRYSAIKKKCCVDKPVPSQVILGKNLDSKGAMSIATKLAVQINCKVGGAPWTVAMPLTHLMVVGYDVCRDTVNKKKSFAGIVATLNKEMTRYFSMSYEHSSEEELSDQFGTFMVIACKHFKDVNQRFPERILVYRDGVGDGQLQFVLDHEVADIKKKLTEQIYTQEPLKMAFIVVSKRINTRIFHGNNNPPPGTVVDDVITLPERYVSIIVGWLWNALSIHCKSCDVT